MTPLNYDTPYYVADVTHIPIKCFLYMGKVLISVKEWEIAPLSEV